MSSEVSQQMMALLQELAGLKEIDSAKRPRTSQERAASKQRQLRRIEIRKQIKEVARRNNSTLTITMPGPTGSDQQPT
jgi:hypothetical protein